jgi:hypothetical protein
MPGRPVQPGAQCLPPADGSRFPGKYQEDRLRDILCGSAITQYSPTDAVYHRSVTGDEGGEGVLIAGTHEMIE